MGCDLVVTGDVVLTDRIIPKGFVAVENGRIVAFGAGRGPAATERHDHTGAFILPGAGPTDDRLKFKSANDYHLTAVSPAEVRDVAGVVCTGLTDYDGDARPQGTACDLGADEHK